MYLSRMKKYLLTLFSLVMTMFMAMAAGGYTCEGEAKVTKYDVLQVQGDDTVGQDIDLSVVSFEYGIDAGTLPLSYHIYGDKLPNYVPSVIGRPGNDFDLVTHPLHGKHVVCSCLRC